MRSSRRELFLQLAPLLRSGVPLKESLGAIAERKGPRSAAARLLERIEAGESLADAMASISFRPEHVALVRAGEEAGRLTEMLESVLGDDEQLRRARRSLLQQSVYPLAVLVLVFVLQGVSLYVVSGRWLESYAALAPVLLVLAAAAFLLWRGPAVLPRGGGLRSSIERLLLVTPGLRALLVDRILGRALRLESRLLEAGMSFEGSLPVVRESVGWDVVASEIDLVRRDIGAGRTAAVAFSRLSRLPRSALDRIAHAERAGRLDAELAAIGSQMIERYLHRMEVTLRVVPIIVYLLAGAMVLRYGLSVLGGASLR